MKKALFVLIASALLIGAALKLVSADLKLIPGTYNLEWDPNFDCSFSVRGKSYSGDDAKSRILKLPNLVSKKPLFYAVQFDGASDEGLLVYAVDESHGAGYDTIYADLNRNRNLADDKPIIITPPNNNGMQRSTWVKIPSHQGPANGVHLEKPVKVSFTVSVYGDTVYVNMSRKGAWRGKIDTNKGKIDCMTEDSNTNGVYGDRAAFNDDLMLKPVRLGDFFYADVNLSGKISTEPAVEMPHLLCLQEATMVAGKLYTLSVSPTGDRVTINNYTGKTGKLLASADKMKSLDASITSLSIIGKAGYHVVSYYDGAPIILPAGKYQFNRCTVSIKQSTGSQMNLDCTPDLTVDVKAGQDTKAELGGKFMMRGIEPDKRVVYLSASNRSRAGWYMNLGNNITVARIGGTGNYNSYMPDVKLFDNSGRAVGASKARYT